MRRGITGRTSGERGFTTSLLKKQNLALVGVSSIRLRFVWELGLSTAGVVISLPLDTPEVCLKGSEQASSMRSEGGIAAFDSESSRGCGGGGDVPLSIMDDVHVVLQFNYCVDQSDCMVPLMHRLYPP